MVGLHNASSQEPTTSSFTHGFAHLSSLLDFSFYQLRLRFFVIVYYPYPNIRPNRPRGVTWGRKTGGRHKKGKNKKRAKSKWSNKIEQKGKLVKIKIRRVK